MKKALSLVLAAAFLTISVDLPSQANCNNFHRRRGCSQASEPGFIYNSQSKSGLFAKGTSSKLKAVFYAGFDYSISICGDASLGSDIAFTLTDATTGEVLYDNATDNKAQHMEFSCEGTRNMNIMISIPGAGPAKGQAEDGACLGILIEQKPTPKVGF
ncbi:MAG: hypothetical protein IM638_09505 [Bacteroidetes bacterium]|nr:hypothetical protein [Bacteroidota bacterium]